MKRLFASTLALLFMGLLPAKADEGMWLPMFIKRLNYTDMQREGLQLTAEEIYSINNSSLKDAIAHFGGGCTSEVVSGEGLLLTNHHCGFSYIANHSTAEKDYLKNGFWAYDKSEELTNPDLKASFLVRMEDVTDELQKVLRSDMSESERQQALVPAAKAIEEKASENGRFRAQVKSFFKGNEFYLFVYEDYTDVRLVGAPPSSIGKYGGDTDNWMWPRHTGDFSMFRIYADKDNNPAAISDDNVPYKPKHHLPVNIGGIKEDDFAMIMGYPGSTERYLTSWGIEFKIQEEYPAFVEARDLKLKIMKEAMDASDEVRINYASNYARTANYWKNRIGMIKALTKNRTADKKRKIESDLEAWINADEERKAEYGEIFDLYREYYRTAAATIKGDQYLMQAGIQGSSFGLFSLQLGRMVQGYLASQSDDSKQAIVAAVDAFYGETNLALEEKLMRGLFALVYERTPYEQLPAEFSGITKEFNGDIQALVDAVVAQSILFQPEQLKTAIAEGKDLENLGDDLGMRVFNSFIQHYFASQQDPARSEMSEKLNRANRKFVRALRMSNPEHNYYPDANSTMRLTYGKVLPYYPRDGVKYQYYTTLAGVIEKYQPGDDEFDLPQKLIDLYDAKDYGNYADENGKLPVAFLTNHDITGGNSGSPVINAKGELIGTAFDGNWEAMSGDIEFEQNLQRTISVDIRYTLFIIEKYAGAKNIIDELTIVR